MTDYNVTRKMAESPTAGCFAVDACNGKTPKRFSSILDWRTWIAKCYQEIHWRLPNLTSF